MPKTMHCPIHKPQTNWMDQFSETQKVCNCPGRNVFVPVQSCHLFALSLRYIVHARNFMRRPRHNTQAFLFSYGDPKRDWKRRRTEMSGPCWNLWRRFVRNYLYSQKLSHRVNLNQTGSLLCCYESYGQSHHHRVTRRFRDLSSKEPESDCCKHFFK